MVRLARSLIHEAVDRADPATRRGLLDALAEIELAAGDVPAARRAVEELASAAPGDAMPLMRAVAARSDAAVRLEEGDARGALTVLRTAWAIWQELDAPYEAARARVLVALSCRALGDHDACSLELGAAREVFASLGAAPERARIDSLASRGRPSGAHGLTARELEVLRRVAAGDGNRDIATALSISEHTVARHVQNIFAKLGVSSRTAASAFAFEHDLASPTWSGTTTPPPPAGW
jgi:DNA-binding CsgD family transcriptional regulator